MYMLIKDTLSPDDKWLVGSYDAEGKWENAPIVAGCDTPSYNIDIATQHLSNLLSQPEEKVPEQNGSKVNQNTNDTTKITLGLVFFLIAVFIVLPIVLRLFAFLIWLAAPLLLVAGLLFVAYLVGK